MKHIIPFLILLAGCRPSPPKTPFIEGLIRKQDTVTFNKIINNREIRIHAIADSLLIISQDDKRIDTIPFDNHFFAYNDLMDLNEDHQTELLIYGVPNMHGQMRPFTFLSDKDGWLHYRPDLNYYNLGYDSAIKHVISFYKGGINSTFSKNIYRRENDSLKLLRGVSLHAFNNENGRVINWYGSSPDSPYNTIKMMEEITYDTAVFQSYPHIPYFTD